ncbi:MAG: hypothetical protein HFJ17_04260 [Clostridia bacterium]|nr:hypothetical protein [Clostridia bacterium]
MIIILIIIILSVAVYKMLKKKQNIEYEENNPQEDFVETYGKNDDGTIDQQAYFDISACIRQYLSIINTENNIYYTYNESNKYTKIDEKQIKQSIYNVLSQEYINKNKVTVENVFSHVKTLNQTLLFVPLEMSMIQDAEVKSFIVHGLVETLGLEVSDEIFVIVNIDMANELFSIYPIDGKYSKIEDIKKVDKLDNVISDNGNNQYQMITVRYEDMAKEYINTYKRLAIGKPELAYEYLDEEYREARYGDVNKFKQYVKENKEAINSITLDKYDVSDKGNYKQFVCIDKNGFYYIFKQNSILDFSLITDTHTIDIPEFTEKYEKANEKEKVAMNINKIVEALNMKDYTYVYNKLSKGFRNNNFKTQKDFEDFAKIYFKNINKVEFGEYSKKADTHIFSIVLTDVHEKSTLKLNFDILMRLGDGSDFVMTMSGVN